MKKNSLTTTVLMAAVSVALLIYFVFQGIAYFTDPLSTTLAYTYRVEDSISLSGYVVRQERVLENEQTELMEHLRQEGERVSKGGMIAAVYADQATLDARREIESLTAQLQQLQFAREAQVGVEVSQKLDQQIRQNILNYQSALTAGDLSDARRHGDQLRFQVLKRDYTGVGVEDLTGQIQEVETQLKTLKSQTSGSIRRIKAPVAGVYSAVVDGYETVLQPELLAQMTPVELASVKPDSAVKSNVGKLLLGKEWYYTAAISTENLEKLQKESRGQPMKLRFTKSVGLDLDVEIFSVGPEENGRCVVTFVGDQYLPQLTLLRQQSAQVIFGFTEGIRVPEASIRVKTGVKTEEDGTETEISTVGVYCVVGMEAQFKPVEVLYTGEDFSLVKANHPPDREKLRLRPGDEVIVAARDLFNGKVVG